ncbi:MAG: hypothetical protein Pg6B_07940 [Candidatus Azobacteroides pseudotrichonymphae]|jgi:FixJ family two-component response regulator|nr:MAG: hypothetical protein Pg6B_07940 [Candidatus Azobacteroides pseudotrichonymphae]
MILPIKTREINDQIGQINNEILKKEIEKDLPNKNIARNLFISATSTSVQKQKDSTGRMQVVGNEVRTQSQINPNLN